MHKEKQPPDSTSEVTSWSFLQRLPGLAAVPAEWRNGLGPLYAGFRSAFLQRTARTARSHPCPRHCGCAHEITRAEALIGVCRCVPWRCPDLVLTPDEIAVWELSWPRLVRALCRAFGLQTYDAIELNVPRTRQLGFWSAGAVPVLLTLPSERLEFLCTVSQLVARLRQPFILLAPTSRFVDVPVRELLAGARAGFFDLATHVSLSEQGLLAPTRAPGELFAAFTPEPAGPAEEDLALRAFALVQKLDADSPLKPPTLPTVFRLYCMEGLSVSQIARQSGCARATVRNRLALLQMKTNVSPDSLRRLSPHLARLERDLADSRAARIEPRRLFDDGPD